MPAFSLETNVAVTEDQTATLLSSITDIVAEVLEKPKAYVTVVIKPNCALTFGGTKDPAAICSLHSIEKINRENNAKVSEKIADLLKKELNVSPTRYYVNFQDMDRPNVGFNKTVF